MISISREIPMRFALHVLTDAVAPAAAPPMKLATDDERELLAAIKAALPPGHSTVRIFLEICDDAAYLTSAAPGAVLTTPQPTQVATCDGSPDREPWSRGWGVVFESGEAFSGKIDGITTNQRAEIYAAIAAVHYSQKTQPLEIRSDSQYVVKTVNGVFRRKTNHDLWTELDHALKRREAATTWTWIRGHDGDRPQEHADRLARNAARRPTTPERRLETWKRGTRTRSPKPMGI